LKVPSGAFCASLKLHFVTPFYLDFV